ncbi:nuclear transport factor 2 family protein [Sphingomonas sp. UYP23]
MNDDKHLKTWNIYQSAWSPIGGTERRELLRQSVSDDIVYTDPASQVHGADALAERICKSQQQVPGSRFRNDSFIEHRGQGIFQWTMLNGEGADAVKGSSFARFGEDGRLVQATGFFEAKKG